MVAVTHLALLGVKRQGAALSGEQIQKKEQSVRAALFKISDCEVVNLNKGNWNFNKSQRMQLKALVCVLGLALLLILALGKLFWSLFLGEKEPGPGPEEPVPVIEVLHNVWIMEEGPEGIMVFHDGREEQYAFGQIAEEGQPPCLYSPPEAVREQLADVELTDGAVTDIRLKKEKINGKVLRADGSCVEVEGYGVLPLAEDYGGYRLYDSLVNCTPGDLNIGYDFADFVLEDGKICGILIIKEEPMKYIRVLLKNSDYGGIWHEELEITSDVDFTVQYGASGSPVVEAHAPGETIVIGKDNGFFDGEDSRVVITPGVLTGRILLGNVKRSQGTPGYRGHIELIRTEKGIAVINEVLLEEYLYSVVPSEMPSSYPDEALQAQAVCARTYAYKYMQRAGYPQYGAHVDDSASYQVYNNILEQESTTTAVKETYGRMLLTPEGGIAGTYYYSTSCGVGSDATVWKTAEAESIDYLGAKAVNAAAVEAQRTGQPGEMDDIGERLREEENFRAFITTKNANDYEVAEGWYRWSYQVHSPDLERMLEVLQKRYDANEKLVLTLEDGEYVGKPVEELDKITDMYIAGRGSGGVADELVIVTGEHTYKVISEHNIRYVLCNGESKVNRQDGSQIATPSLLPSAFFILSTSKEKENVVGYTLTGGGFGHGVGMSQNGARSMAKSGMTSEEILAFFYEGCHLESIYEPSEGPG